MEVEERTAVQEPPEAEPILGRDQAWRLLLWDSLCLRHLFGIAGQIVFAFLLCSFSSHELLPASCAVAASVAADNHQLFFDKPFDSRRGLCPALPGTERKSILFNKGIYYVVCVIQPCRQVGLKATNSM